jgi:hypothetical protein
VGTPLDPSHVRRDFRKAIDCAPELNPDDWTPRELRHSFVSLLSDSGVSLDQISLLVGHSSTAVTEAVYRMQIRPVLQGGAVAMDRIFKTELSCQVPVPGRQFGSGRWVTSVGLVPDTGFRDGSLVAA